MIGCSKMDSREIIEKFEENIDKDYYIVNGQMDIVSNEEMYHYDVTVKHLNDYYMASLVNKDTNYEQIILKNKDGVYVITPSLNKSFKYQSDWPFNSSQSYILESLLNDLKNAKKFIFMEYFIIKPGMMWDSIHEILLSKNIVLLEGIKLGNVSEGKYFLCAQPLNIKGIEGSPCRAILIK